MQAYTPFVLLKQTEVIYSRMHNDIFKWREDNPTPATMMIISDEAKYVFGTSLALRAQQDNKYNLFWAYSFRPREMSVMVTSAEWLWDSLLAGVLFFTSLLSTSTYIYIYIYI